MILSEFWPFKQNIQNSKIQFSKFQFTFFPTVFNNLRHFLKRRFIKFGLIIVQRTVTKKIKSKWLILPPNLAPPYPIRDVWFGARPCNHLLRAIIVQHAGKFEFWYMIVFEFQVSYNFFTGP